MTASKALDILHDEADEGKLDKDLLDVFERDRPMAMDFMAMLARWQLALVERRAHLGFEALATRDVSRLGSVRVGA